MSRRLLLPALFLFLAGCAAVDDQGTIAQLRNRQIEIKDVKLEGGLEKAMESYRRFLEETPTSALSPEAIRRLADLKVEKEYGLITESGKSNERPSARLPAPKDAPPPVAAASREPAPPIAAAGESEAAFETRATLSTPVAETTVPKDEAAPVVVDLERAGALEAIELYRKLLNDYPLYQRNDQVLYQMSRAYEELGRIEEAMEVMDRLVRDFPESRYLDEVQFRRAEYFFTHRRYLDAEDAYKSIVEIGVSSSYFQLALFKLGWTFYKQELYEEALHRFIALLDYKVSVGYDFAQSEDEIEAKRMEDTFRVISLGFSNIGGAGAVADYFAAYGKRSYEDGVYANLGEYYYDKRRYSDATATYNAFVSRNPFHARSPLFHMRVIEINIAGGFPSLVIDSKKAFATTYGLRAEYWRHFDPSLRPDVLGHLKTNLTDLANHYHALYRNPRQTKEKPDNFAEALHWYREFLVSFPVESESPAINYQLADLLLENRSFAEAAVEYEKTAYDYPRHEKSATAGYAAVFAYREHLGALPPAEREPVKRQAVRSSLKFAETFPTHEKAAIVLGAAADDLYDLGDYEESLAAALWLVQAFPATEVDIRRGAWLIVAHSSFKLLLYGEAESAYGEVLALLPEGDRARGELLDNLAASIYKQGEKARALEDYRGAANHFLRVGAMAPDSKFRPTAEYDAAAVLTLLQDWKMTATVLLGFRANFPGHELQPEVTKKLAYVYRQDGLLSLSANEYERIERESPDDEVRQGALLTAAQLHRESGDSLRALTVYRRYVGYFPQPVELNLETRGKIAEILKEQKEKDAYLDELRAIVAIEAAAGDERTPRTRVLAAGAALVLAELSYDQFVAVPLVKPFKVNLAKKQTLMKVAIKDFSRLLDYEVGEVTAAATFYLAEIYAHLSEALLGSERPEGLSPLEMEQYELAIEEQAYPFEEKAITVHKSNLELISLGIYNPWIDRSLQKLAEVLPARYARPEEESPVIASLDSYTFAVDRPLPPVVETETEEPVAGDESVPVEEVMPVEEAMPVEESVPVEETMPVEESVPVEETVPVEEPMPVEEAVPVEVGPEEPTSQPAGTTSMDQ